MRVRRLPLILPGLLAVVAALTFWSRIRESRPLRTTLPGINASVLGILVAAFLRPVCSTAIHSVADVLVAAGALALLTIGITDAPVRFIYSDSEMPGQVGRFSG